MNAEEARTRLSALSLPPLITSAVLSTARATGYMAAATRAGRVFTTWDRDSGYTITTPARKEEA